jgi:hypothetical protein
LQYYQVVVSSYFNTTNITNGTSDGSAQSRILFKGTEVIRDKVIKLLYFKDKGKVNISFYPAVSGGIFDLNLALSQVAAGTGSIYSAVPTTNFLVPTTAKVLNNVTNLTDSIYDIIKPGYYLFSV